MTSRAWLLVLFIPWVGHATTVRSYFRNLDGVRKFAQKSYFPAYQAFLHALEEDPLNPAIHLNLALSFEANEENEKAEQGYKGALRIIPENSPNRFQALFNLGGVLGKQQKIDEALHAYQAALALDPESKDVKTNIELLWQNGGGGGGGKDDKNKKNQDQKQGGNQEKKENQNPDQKEPKKQPKPFESQELTPQDVKKILDEIKNQEQSIRAQEYERNAKEAPRGKDW